MQEDTMRSIAPLAAIALALSVALAHAAPPTVAGDGKPTVAKSAQQNRMKSCSADAKLKALTGPDRRAFMSDCLKKKA
jgi:hypothetical protein